MLRVRPSQEDINNSIRPNNITAVVVKMLNSLATTSPATTNYDAERVDPGA